VQKDQLLQVKSTGVKKFIVSIGTNDLLQLPLNSIGQTSVKETTQ